MDRRDCFLVHLKQTISVTFPWLSNAIVQQGNCTGVCVRLRQRRRWWLSLPVCNVLKEFEVGKHVQVFDWMFVSIEFTTLSGFNALGRAANSQILLSCKVKVFRMVYCVMFKSPGVWDELLSAWKFGAMESGLLWHCWRHARSGVFTVERGESWGWAWAVRCGYKLTILERFIEPQHHHKEVPHTPVSAETMHARCPIIRWINKNKPFAIQNPCNQCNNQCLT